MLVCNIIKIHYYIYANELRWLRLKCPVSQSSLYPIIVGQYYGISLCIAESLILVYLGQCDNTRGAICVVSSVAFTVEFTLELWLVEDYENYACRKQLNLPLIGLLEYACSVLFTTCSTNVTMDTKAMAIGTMVCPPHIPNWLVHSNHACSWWYHCAYGFRIQY